MAAKWKEILVRERESILSGGHPAGEVLYTVSELAGRYGVCYVTAHRVAKQLAREGLIRSISKVGCVRARERRDHPVYLLTPEELKYRESNLIHALEMKGIFSEADSLGIDVQSIGLPQILHVADEAPMFLLYFYGANYLSSELMLRFLPRRVFPIALNSAGRMERGQAVGSDSRRMVEELVGRLLAAGLTRIGYLGPYDSERARVRLDAFHESVTGAGLRFEPEWIFSVGKVESEHYQSIRKWIARNRLEAVCTPGMPFALALQDFLFMSRIGGVRVATIGCPQQEDCPEYCMCPDYENIGREAVRLVGRIDLDDEDACAGRDFLTVPARFMGPENRPDPLPQAERPSERPFPLPQPIVPACPQETCRR